MIAFVDRLGELVVAATSIEIDLPAETAVGNVLIAVIAIDTGGTTRTITPPAGWTLIQSVETAGFHLKLAMYRNVVDASDVGPFVWTFSAAVDAVGVLLAYSGVDTAAVVNVSGSQANSATTTITAPSVAPTLEDTMLIGAWATTANAALITAPGSLNTVHFDIGNTIRLVVGQEARGADEATGARLATSSASGEVAGILAALNEAVAVVEGFQDNYKSKLIRQTLSPVFDNRLSEPLPKLLTVIGTSDNFIGGLLGDEDFLPDEVP